MSVCDPILKTTLETLQDYFCRYKLSLEQPTNVTIQVLNEYKELLGITKTVIAGMEDMIKQLSGIVKNLNTLKSQAHIPKEKKGELILIDKGKPKAAGLPTIEANKDISGLSFKLISEHLCTVDYEDFIKLMNNTIDTLPVLSLKVNNMVANRDLFEYSLTLFWKMIKQPQKYIRYPEKQVMIGVPELLPYKYPKKGDIFKKIKGNSEDNFDKKTCFYFQSKILHIEIVRILKKLQSTSAKLFATKEVAKTDDEKKELKTFGSIKAEIATKLSLYKIHFLSTCIIKFMNSDSFDLQSCYAELGINMNEFDRRKLQVEHLTQWEKSILS